MIYILMGPSGSGKTAIGKMLSLPELISHTSRDMRKGEVHGETYYFVTKKDIEKMDKAEFTEYAGNYYCLSTKEVDRKLKENKAVFVIMDRNGAEQMVEMYGDEVRVVYIDVSLPQLFLRLFKRDGLKGAIKRTWHMFKTGERKNEEIADFVIANNNGELEKSVAILEEIIRLHVLTGEIEIDYSKAETKLKKKFRNYGDLIDD